MRLTYATRRSALALAQCRAFVDRVRAARPDVELVELQIVTSGDKIQDRPLSEVGGKGLFVKEIEEALLDGRADFAVHSIKDVPGVLPDGLSLACVPARVDPRDALVAPRHRTLEALPHGARVGTSSLRRMVALRAARPDLVVVPMRGNVDTRLRKVGAGECDAIVLAMAGLTRLGLEGRATEPLAPEVMLPAVGQGALGVETRTDDADTRRLLASLHDGITATCVAAERGVMIALQGDCRTPIAAYAEEGSMVPDEPGYEPRGGVRRALRLRAFAAEPDGTGLRAEEVTLDFPGDEAAAAAVGRALGRRLAR
jgi:hydroxymethylbilane synthase